MPREFSRSRRIAELLQRELAQLVQQYTKNTEMGIVTLSAIDVSPDLKNAKIFVTCIGNSTDITEIINNLNQHVNQFRHDLSKMVTLRYLPKLKFEFDYSLERANKVSDLIDSLHSKKINKNNTDS